jgi:hypothetical protein
MNNMEKPKITPIGQYELDFDQSIIDEQKEAVEQAVEQKDLMGRTRKQAAKDFRVMNPEELYFDDKIKKWMKDGIPVEEWDDMQKRLNEPGPDDFVRGNR